jgi:hypothetical protein
MNPRNPTNRTTHVSPPRKAVAAAFGVGLLLIVGAALATPSFNVITAPLHARGTTEGKLDVSSEAGTG